MNEYAAKNAQQWAREEARCLKDIKRLNKAIEQLNCSKDDGVLKIKALMSLEIARLAEEREQANAKLKYYLARLYAMD